MNCPECNIEVRSSATPSSKFSLEPINPKLNSVRNFFTIPFHCKKCGSIQFKYRAVRDVVFLYPLPKPQKVGSIHLPDYDGRSWNTQEHFRRSLGVVISLGKGAWNKEGRFFPSSELEIGDIVYYEKSVPWAIEVENLEGKEIEVKLCGYQDCYLRVEDVTEKDVVDA